MISSPRLEGACNTPARTLRRGTPEDEPFTASEPAAQDEQLLASPRRIVCIACRHRITTDQERVPVNGRFEHRCINPDGLRFHIGCFRRAPGCTAQGVPTTEFTWFPGFAWNYALCNGCSALLGWKFQGTDSASFFGLILNRLETERERSH